MRVEFSIMLKQCEEIAKELILEPMGETFLSKLDIFDNYFAQLMQIIEAGELSDKINVTYLHSMLPIIEEKISTEYKKTKNEQNVSVNRKSLLSSYTQPNPRAKSKLDRLL